MAEIKIKLPDGRVGTIPEENLKEAQKRGATVIQPKQTLQEKAVNTGKGLVDSALESGEDIARGALEGATFGGSDEILGGVTALGGLATGQVKSTDDLVNLYKKYRDQEQEKQRISKERSPYLYGAGELAGTVGGSLLTGGAALEAGIAKKLGSTGIKEAVKAGGGLLSKDVAKEVGKQAAASAVSAAPYGALFGALGSNEGKLIDATPEEQEKLKDDAISGAMSGGLVGGVLGAGLSAGKGIAEKASQSVSALKQKMAENQTSPFIRQIAKSYEMGEKGINPNNQEMFLGSLNKPESLDSALSTQPTKDASKLLDRYLEGDKFLGQNVGRVVDEFVDDMGNPKALNIDKTIKGQINDFLKYSEKDPSINLNENAKKVFDHLNDLSQLTPTARAVMNARDDLYRFAETYKMKDSNVAGFARDLANKLGQDLKTQVPGYKEASERLRDYRHLFGEGTLAGDTPLDYFSNKISRTKESEAKLLDKFRGMIERVSAPGEAGRSGQESFTNLLKNLQELQEKDPKIFETIGLDPSKIESFIKKASDEASSVSLMRGYAPHSSEATEIKGLATGIIGAGKGKLLSTTRVLGSANQKIADFSRNLSKATDDKLMQLSVKLPETLRKSLTTAINNKDLAAKNSVLFSLMQNPEYRKLITEEDIVSDENK